MTIKTSTFPKILHTIKSCFLELETIEKLYHYTLLLLHYYHILKDRFLKESPLACQNKGAKLAEGVVLI